MSAKAPAASATVTKLPAATRAPAAELPSAGRLEVWQGRALVYARDVTPLVLAS